MVSAQDIADIEATLAQQWPGAWRRLTLQEMGAAPLPLFASGWRIDLAEGTVRPADVHHLLLVVDGTFPNSQPRILAPQLGSDFRWPHVEPWGLLCLRPTLIVAPTGDRIRTHLHDALALLNWSEEQCCADFEREFGSYWSQRAIKPSEKLRVLSLVKPGGASRQLVFHADTKRGRIVVGDTKAQLGAWLRNAGTQAGDHDLFPALLLKLQRPWLPRQFPQTIGDAIRGVPDEVLRATLLPHHRSVLIFEAETPTGPVFAAVLARGDKNSKVQNGFRSWARVPMEHIKRALAKQRIERVVVSRVDAPWIHGRGHSSDQAVLQACKVAIVGCGAVGSEVAQLLAKAGVGELALIDNDAIESANTSRHILGIGYLGLNKAQSVAAELRGRLPHLNIRAVHNKKFEWLTAAELSALAAVDMILTAGLDIEGEAAVNAWRLSLKRPPAYLSCWVEAYAIAGHAVLLYGQDDLMTAFETERPIFRLTDWPLGAREVIVEAGCGNVFQPHGAADLQPAVAMAAKLALDALLGRVPTSCRRVWYGDRASVTTLGGIVRHSFVENNALREIPW